MSIIFSNDLKELKELFVNKISGKYFFITDEKVYTLYSNELSNYIDNINWIIVPEGEKCKNKDTMFKVIDQLLDLGIRRGNYLIGLGGGAVLDLVGFISSILYRGINSIYIPTTLLSMCDASYGGKTGIDYKDRKNILGTFKNPTYIYINQMFLKTLSKIEIDSGLGEIIKYTYLKKSRLEELLLADRLDFNELCKESLAIKEYYVSKDQFDNGVRMMLNLGHTFGHIIEIENNLPHGIAVLCGIRMIIDYEIDLGLLSTDYRYIFNQRLAKLGITIPSFRYQEYLKKIFLDKKNINGVLKLIFISKDEPYFYEVVENEIKN